MTARESSRPALDAYDEISVLRDKHADVIWSNKEASPAELRALLADLDAGLAKLSTPINTDLAEGNVYLRFRRVNFLIDKVIVLDRLEDPTAAIRAWQEIEQITWFDPARIDQTLVGTPFRRLLERPEAATIRAQLQVAAWWREGQALAGPYQEKLTVEERIAGLSRIWAAARDGFVWFDHASDLDWDRAYLDAIPRVMAAQDTETYYRELMQFVALLRDGHSNVYPPEEIAKRFYSRPGVRTAKVEGRVIVMDVTDSDLSREGLRVGDEVVGIDGIDVERYARERVMPYQSSSTDQDLAVRTYSYALLTGSAERPAQLEVRDRDGKQTTLTAMRSGYASTGGHPRKAFEMREDGIAVITAIQFENGAAAEALGQHIAQVMQAKGLILDLRGNGGGSGNLGFALLSWLSDASLPSMVSSYRESNALDRARMGKSVTVVWRNVAGQEFRLPRDPVFQGPVALLIDARTFSAAEDTAAVFKLMHRGIVIGSASGGSTGQPWLFDLPGGGTARICVKRDSYPDGTTFVGTGIVPDIEVPLTIKDVREGRDAVIERAVHELSKGRNLAGPQTMGV